MRKGHVADTQIAKQAQHADIVADHVAAFDTDKRGDLTFFVCAPHFVGGTAKHQIIGILADVFVHGVDLVERLLYGGRPHDASINVDGEKNRIHSSFAHARDV